MASIRSNATLSSMMVFSAVYAPAHSGSPAIASAAEAQPLATTDQDRIVDAVKHVRPSVVSLLVTVNGTRTVAPDPFSQLSAAKTDLRNRSSLKSELPDRASSITRPA